MYSLDVPSGRKPAFPFTNLKVVAYALASPLLLIAVIAALPVVMIDFAVFRFQDLLLGHPQPKGLWEF